MESMKEFIKNASNQNIDPDYVKSVGGLSEDLFGKIEKITLDLILADKAYRRGGDYIKKVFQNPDKELSGQECMNIMNIYGMYPRDIYLMAISHGFQINKEDFVNLYNEQREISKNMRQCC